MEVRVDRTEKKEPEKTSGGWFGGWFGGGTSAPVEEASTSTAQIAKQFEEALTIEEKNKLYSAIDYTEGAAPVDYPHTYLDYVLNFQLHRLRSIIRDLSGKRGPEKILDLQIVDVVTSYAEICFENMSYLHLPN